MHDIINAHARFGTLDLDFETSLMLVPFVSFQSATTWRPNAAATWRRQNAPPAIPHPTTVIVTNGVKLHRTIPFLSFFTRVVPLFSIVIGGEFREPANIEEDWGRGLIGCVAIRCAYGVTVKRSTWRSA